MPKKDNDGYKELPERMEGQPGLPHQDPGAILFDKLKRLHGMNKKEGAAATGAEAPVPWEQMFFGKEYLKPLAEALKSLEQAQDFDTWINGLKLENLQFIEIVVKNPQYVGTLAKAVVDKCGGLKGLESDLHSLNRAYNNSLSAVTKNGRNATLQQQAIEQYNAYHSDIAAGKTPSVHELILNDAEAKKAAEEFLKRVNKHVVELQQQAAKLLTALEVVNAAQLLSRMETKVYSTTNPKEYNLSAVRERLLEMFKPTSHAHNKPH